MTVAPVKPLDDMPRTVETVVKDRYRQGGRTYLIRPRRSR